jgi:hypothetical protein
MYTKYFNENDDVETNDRDFQSDERAILRKT